MNNRIVRCSIVFLTATLLSYGSAAQSKPSGAEKNLIETFRINKIKGGRLSLSSDPYLFLKNESYISKKRDRRMDYTDYYLIKKSLRFLGHEVMLIEDEYPSKDVGCCVSPGLGITVKLTGSLANLQAYAKANKCSLEDKADLNGTLKSLQLKAQAVTESYAYLSCRERDKDMP